MKESKSRTEQFMYTASTAANHPPSSKASFPAIWEPALTLGLVLYNSQRGGADPMGDGSIAKFDPKGKSRAPQNGDMLALDLDSAEEGAGASNGSAFMQMQLVEQQVREEAPP
jgi:syntaxin 5